MKTITKEELAEILRKHKMWLANEPDGERADLSCADLSGADLSYADLLGTDLNGADLSYADLSYADLSGADLSGANLHRANLYRTDLHGADLSYADLSYADLSGADLSSANLLGINPCEVQNMSCPLSCPEKGSFIAFKKSAYCYVDNTNKNFIIELEIPEDALRVSATGRKCRASKAKVVSITNLDGTPTDVKEVSSTYDRHFKYRVGETVEVDDFDTNRWDECSTGIHFFITREEAVNY